MGTRDTHKLNIDQGHVWRRVSYDDYDDDVHQRKTITKTTTKIQGFLRCCCVKQGWRGGQRSKGTVTHCSLCSCFCFHLWRHRTRQKKGNKADRVPFGSSHRTTKKTRAMQVNVTSVVCCFILLCQRHPVTYVKCEADWTRKGTRREKCHIAKITKITFVADDLRLWHVSKRKGEKSSCSSPIRLTVVMNHVSIHSTSPHTQKLSRPQPATFHHVRLLRFLTASAFVCSTHTHTFSLPEPSG